MSLSAETIEQLRAEMQRPDRRTMSQIAADLGTTKGTVAGAFNRAGIKTGPSHMAVQSKLDGQIDKIRDLVSMGACAWAIAQEVGCANSTLRRFAAKNNITIRQHTPVFKNAGARRSLGGTFGKRGPLAQHDRLEMDRLRDEAIAAGKVTKLPAGHAYGALKWGRSEYAS